MVPQRLACRRAVPRGDLRDDIAVLASEQRQRAGLRERLPPVQLELVDEAPVGGEQLGVAGVSNESVVELEVQHMVGIDVALRGGTLHALDDRPELLHLLGAGRLGDAPPGPFVDDRTHLVDLVSFLDADLADEHAAVLFLAHEAGFLESAECLAHGAARHAQPLRERDLVELGADAQVAGQDHALQLLLHQHRQRARLEQRDGRGWRCRSRRLGGNIRYPVHRNCVRAAAARVSRRAGCAPECRRCMA